MAVQVKEFRISNDALHDANELRRRVDQDGYLFFRELLDPAILRDFRLQVLKVCREAGWLKADSKLVDGVAEVSRLCMEPEPAYVAVYRNVQKMEAFHRLAHSPAILDVIEKLLGEAVFPHPTKIGRVMFPQNAVNSTPPHQDYVHIQGTPETYTCWMPLGDCPRELGGLALLAGSHKGGVYEYHVARGAGGMGVDTDRLSGDWVASDFQNGDALIFHSMTIHKGLPNLTPDRLRLSVDYRYQGASQPILETNLQTHGNFISWEEVYASWQSKDLQYYWKSFDPKTVSRDWTYYEKRDAEALEMARQGNEVARAALLRIITRNPNPEKRKAAEEALSGLDAKASAKN